MSTSSRAEWWRPDAGTGERRVAVVVAPRSPAPDSAIPFWALMGFTFILLIAPQTFIPSLAPLRVALLAGAVAIAAHVLDCFVQRRPVSRFPEMWLAACLIGWAIVTVPMSYWPGGSVSFLLGVYVKPLAIFWLLGNVVNTLARLRRIAWGLTLMGVPIAAAAVQNFLSGSFVLGASRIVGYEAPLTGNPNDLALMLNLILPLSAALLLTSRRVAVRALLVGIMALAVIAVVTTFSRAGFLTLATVLFAYVWKLVRRPERVMALAALVLALVSIPLLPSDYVARLETITKIESDPTGSAQARWNDTVAAVHWVLGHPIVGAGIGQNGIALNEMRGPAWKVIHNVYLEYAVELGIPGLALFLLLLGRSIGNVRFVQRQAGRASEFRELFYLAEGIEISLIAFTVAAFFSPVGYQFYFYYMAGLAMAARTVLTRAQ